MRAAMVSMVMVWGEGFGFVGFCGGVNVEEGEGGCGWKRNGGSRSEREGGLGG